MDNLFYTGYTGSQVSKRTFLGRFDIYEDFQTKMREQVTSQGLSVIGLNRIGKTSFVNEYIRKNFKNTKRPNTILIERTLSHSSSANRFWHSFASELRTKWEFCGEIDSMSEKSFTSILSGDIEAPTWFESIFQINIKSILVSLQEKGFRLIFVIDEFDHAREIFAKNGGLSLIRDLGTSANLDVTVITMSRRTLAIIQKEAVGTGSTLSESFTSIYLSHFNERDMRELYNAFSDYDIFLQTNEACKNRLQFYAGTHPYLLSIYSYHIVQAKLRGEDITASLIDEIKSLEYGKIEGYYKTVLERMIEDGYAEDIRSVLCGPHTRLTQHDVGVYQQWGYLSLDSEGYYTISRDFTKYFIKGTQTLSLPEWDAVMQAENILKGMVERVYPRLNEFIYTTVMSSYTWCNDIISIYPELSFFSGRNAIEANFKKAWQDYGIEETLIGALTLGSIVEHIILKNWAKFKPFFRNEEKSTWQYHLKLLVRARNPLAHNHPEYLTDTEKRQLPATCTLISELVIPV